MAAGDTYGASLAGSASSGAAQSGANSFQGGVALGPAYGAGSVLVGTPADTANKGISLGQLLIVAAIFGVIAFGWKLFKG